MTGDYSEDREIYNTLREAVFSDVQPEGMVEMMLTDKLFTYYWRHQRIVAAERALVENQFLSGTVQAYFDDIGQYMAIREEGVAKTFYRRIQTKRGRKDLIDLLYSLITDIEENGLPLAQWGVDFIQEELGATALVPQGGEILMCHQVVVSYNRPKSDTTFHREDCLPKISKKEAVERAIAAAKSFRDWLLMLDDIYETDAFDRKRSVLHSKLMPDATDTLRIQRYEAHLHRCFLQTLHELQRVQAARRGQGAPMTAALDVTVE